MGVMLEPIGYVRTEVHSVPHFWDVSQLEGDLVIDEELQRGLEGLHPGQRVWVIFLFHRSLPFCREDVLQTPRRGDKKTGVFSISTPLRPNPLGLSALEIIEIQGCRIKVRGLDMVDGTPILDIKPYVGWPGSRQTPPPESSP